MNIETSELKNRKINGNGRTRYSNQNNFNLSKDSQSFQPKSANFSNGDKRDEKKQKNNKYWKDIDTKDPQLSKNKGKKENKPNKKKKAKQRYKRSQGYKEDEFESGYVKKSIAESMKNLAPKNNPNTDQFSKFSKFELMDFQEFYFQRAESNSNEKQRSRSLSSGRSSNRSSRSEDRALNKTKSLTPKTRQKIIEESKEYLLQPKKFYNLKFQKKLELIRNSPKKIAREFYKIDFQHKFLAAMTRFFKEKPDELKLFNIPLEINDKGEVELISSYYVLLNSIDFFIICRHCKINSFDAAKDLRKKVDHKISLIIKKMKINEDSLGREEADNNLRYNRGRIPLNRARYQYGNNRYYYGEPIWFQSV